jgi:hypothetical protein
MVFFLTERKTIFTFAEKIRQFSTIGGGGEGLLHTRQLPPPVPPPLTVVRRLVAKSNNMLGIACHQVIDPRLVIFTKYSIVKLFQSKL